MLYAQSLVLVTKQANVTSTVVLAKRCGDVKDRSFIMLDFRRTFKGHYDKAVFKERFYLIKGQLTFSQLISLRQILILSTNLSLEDVVCGSRSD
jgi:hypothetical protein